MYSTRKFILILPFTFSSNLELWLIIKVTPIILKVLDQITFWPPDLACVSNECQEDHQQSNLHTITLLPGTNMDHDQENGDWIAHLMRMNSNQPALRAYTSPRYKSTVWFLTMAKKKMAESYQSNLSKNNTNISPRLWKEAVQPKLSTRTCYKVKAKMCFWRRNISA